VEDTTYRQQIIPLIEKFISGHDRSVDHAAQIEVALDEAFPENAEVQNLVIALASYRPEGGPMLYNQLEMVSILSRELPQIRRMLEHNAQPE
jgi:hypothetical protein